MRDLYTKIGDYYQIIKGSGSMIPLWILSLVYCFKTKKESRFHMVYPFVMMLVLIFFPVSGILIMMFLDDGSYARLIWCFMIEFVIAYAASDLWENKEKGSERIAAGLLALALIVTSGNFVFKSANFSIATNPYKVMDATIEVADFLELSHQGELIIVSDEVLNSQLRQYDANIQLLYGRYTTTRIEDILEEGSDAVYDYFRNGPGKNVKCLVMPVDEQLVQLMLGYGWTRDTQIAGFHTYERIPWHKMWTETD